MGFQGGDCRRGVQAFAINTATTTAGTRKTAEEATGRFFDCSDMWISTLRSCKRLQSVRVLQGPWLKGCGFHPDPLVPLAEFFGCLYFDERS